MKWVKQYHGGWIFSPVTRRLYDIWPFMLHMYVHPYRDKWKFESKNLTQETILGAVCLTKSKRQHFCSTSLHRENMLFTSLIQLSCRAHSVKEARWSSTRAATPSKPMVTVNNELRQTDNKPPIFGLHVHGLPAVFVVVGARQGKCCTVNSHSEAKQGCLALTKPYYESGNQDSNNWE